LVQTYLFISRKRLSGPGMLSKIEMLHEGAGLFTISYNTARVSRIIEGDKKIQVSITFPYKLLACSTIVLEPPNVK